MTPSEASSNPIETLVRHAGAIRSLLRRALDPALDADDLAQSSFLRAWRADGEPRRKRLAWWRVLSKNLLRDADRAQLRRSRRERDRRPKLPFRTVRHPSRGLELRLAARGA